MKENLVASAGPAPDAPLNAKQSASECGLSLPAFWRAVGDGRLPAPVYPAARAPRWFRNELREAMIATRALPRDQMARRRAAKLSRAAA